MVKLIEKSINQPIAPLGEVVQYGIIYSVDLQNATAIVDFGEHKSPPLPWKAPSGELKFWLPPTVGQQVKVSAPEGDLNGGIIDGGLFDDNNPAPSNTANPKIVFGDIVIELIFPDTIKIKAATIDIEGNANLAGNLTAHDVIIDGKSMKNHRHGAVQAGASQTSAPV